MRISPASSVAAPFPASARSFPRRRVRAVFDSLTCLVLIKHDESPTQLQVSDDGDPIGAVWLQRTPVLVDPKDRGRFLIVTLPRTMALEKGLALSIIDRERFLPEERADLEDAITAAKRTRDRMSGRCRNRPTWSGGRNVYA